jgi:hypothetical protein
MWVSGLFSGLFFPDFFLFQRVHQGSLYQLQGWAEGAHLKWDAEVRKKSAIEVIEVRTPTSLTAEVSSRSQRSQDTHIFNYKKLWVSGLLDFSFPGNSEWRQVL